MSIDVTVNRSPAKKKEYPWIGTSDNGIVVLFTAPKIGFTINGVKSFSLEHGWDEDDFKPLNGEIVLKNK